MPHFLYGALYDPSSINTKLFLLINHWHHPLLDPLMLALVTIGSSKMVYAYIVLLGIVAIVNRKVMPPSYVFVLAVATVVGLLLEEGLKTFFHVPRPAAALGLEHVRVLGELKLKNSLPSGHAVFAAVIASSLGWRRDWGWNATLWFFAVLVCWSRIYVGAHYPFDVLLGTLVGVFAATAVWTIYEKLPGKVKRGR